MPIASSRMSLNTMTPLKKLNLRSEEVLDGIVFIYFIYTSFAQPRGLVEAATRDLFLLLLISQEILRLIDKDAATVHCTTKVMLAMPFFMYSSKYTLLLESCQHVQENLFE